MVLALRALVMGAVGVALCWIFKDAVKQQMEWYWLLALSLLEFSAMALTWSVALDGRRPSGHRQEQSPG